MTVTNTNAADTTQLTGIAMKEVLIGVVVDEMTNSAVISTERLLALVVGAHLRKGLIHPAVHANQALDSISIDGVTIRDTSIVAETASEELAAARRHQLAAALVVLTAQLTRRMGGLHAILCVATVTLGFIGCVSQGLGKSLNLNRLIVHEIADIRATHQRSDSPGFLSARQLSRGMDVSDLGS